MKLSGNFWKTDETLLEAQFLGNQTKNIITKIGNIFRKIFDEFSVNYQQAVSNSRTSLLARLSFKTRRDLMVTEFEVHTAFGRSMRLRTDLGSTNKIVSFSLAIQ